MKVILQEDVENLGPTGTVVEVADGYGRNFLLPRKLAVLADERNTRRLEHQRRLTARRQAQLIEAARELAARLAGSAVTIRRQAGSEDRIFGSVTNQDIAEALAAQGFEVERRQIDLPEPIRKIGVFFVTVRVHKEVEASVKVFVIAL